LSIFKHYWEFSSTSRTFAVESIHRRYAFNAARKATVSLASIERAKQFPSFAKATLERLFTGALASGDKAAITVSSCFSDGNRKRTVAFAFTGFNLIGIRGKQL
jgi:hypothetical protein